MKEVIVGERHGMLTALHEGERAADRGGRPWRTVVVQCDCGSLPKTIRLGNWGGRTVSCGCLKRESMRETARERFSRQDGLSVTEHSLYRIWGHMLSRCENPDNKSFPGYGGRGIEVCDRWHDFKLFVEDIKRDLGSRPPEHSLDRRDNDGNYEPGNVRWATRSEQSVNTRRRVSGVMGVTPLRSGRWQARISLGVFDSVEEAGRAYDRARMVLREAHLL